MTNRQFFARLFNIGFVVFGVIAVSCFLIAAGIHLAGN